MKLTKNQLKQIIKEELQSIKEMEGLSEPDDATMEGVLEETHPDYEEEVEKIIKPSGVRFSASRKQRAKEKYIKDKGIKFDRKSYKVSEE